MAAVTICRDFGAQDNKVSHCFHCFSIYLPWSDRTGCHDLSFWILSFKPTYSLSSFTFIKRLFSPLHFLPYEWYYLHIWGYWFYGFIIPLFSSSLFGHLQLPSLTAIDPCSPALYLSGVFYSRPPHSQKFLQSLCLHCLDIWVLIQKPIWPGGVVRLLRVQTL